MNVDRASTMGEKRSNLNGLTMASLKRSRGDRSEPSLDRRFGFPVSVRSRFALRSRRIGGYVSLRKMKAETVIVPACSSVEGANKRGERTTYDNGNQPEHPAPTFGLRKKTTGDRTDDRTHQRTHCPNGHDASPFFLHNDVGDCSSTNGQGSGSEKTFEKAPGDEHVQITADGTGDCEDNKEDVTDMVDNRSAVFFRHGGENHGPEGETQDVDRKDKGCQLDIVGFEFGHDFGDARGEHGGSEGPAESQRCLSHCLKPLGQRGCMYVRKVMEEMTATIAYLRRLDQLVGFSGSSGPSQSTMLGSGSCCCLSSVRAGKLCFSAFSTSVSRSPLSGDVSVLVEDSEGSVWARVSLSRSSS